MARIRIIAHFMQEAEKSAAKSRMAEVEETPGYLVGSIEENAISDLQSRGLIVQIVEQPDTPQATRGLDARAPGMRRSIAGMPSFGTETEGGVVAVPLDQPTFYKLGLKGPLLASWRERLSKLEVEILEYLPGGEYLARLKPQLVAEVEDIPFVAGIRLYSSQQNESESGLRSIQPPSNAAKRILTFDVILHRAEDSSKIVQWLQERGVDIAGSSSRKIRVYLLENSPILGQVSVLPEVASLEPYLPPTLHNDVARTLLGIDRMASPPQPVLSQTGEGQVVAVADTGLDDQHPDFRGRIDCIIPRGRPGDASDPDGHGTHVAGSVLGDGSASRGKVQGTAPKARLVIQSLMDSQGKLDGLPLDLIDLFQEAYDKGARIHNNSWGSATQSAYTAHSAEVDKFVASHRDMLVVLSAGNYGTAAQCYNSRPGFVDWLSIGSPASCKNALTVGASRSSRTSGGYSSQTYRQTCPQCFPDPPIADAKVSGDTECMAAFSSRGPCDDHRIKPDVVAPGTDVLSARSSQAPLGNLWGTDPSNPCYAVLGGTSMAAALVTGCAALVREYFVKDRQVAPSAALIKATLINGTRWLTGDDSVADSGKLPNFHQGFGCIDMRTTIPNPASAGWTLAFVDAWQTPASQFTMAGERRQYRVVLSGHQPLRACLAWTDSPGRAVQNNLNLFLQHLPSGRKWMGNEERPMAFKGSPDPENNVEVVRLESPPAGPYLIQITATNVLFGSQDFALVISGGLAGGLDLIG